MKIESNERHKLIDTKFEQIGKSPFYILYQEDIPNFGNSHSYNQTYSIQNWHIESTNLVKAHAITRGNSNQIIAFIDTGTDLKNPDMQASNYINILEDINHNGVLDSLDMNGIDDDGNGYIDDVSGYDFVDTKVTNLAYDFKTIDPFPQDDFGFGHGTFVHNILNTFSPNSRKLPIRAADPNGLLEEDDIAKAIIFAQESGAHIINLSFGSSQYSPFLEAVIDYVYQKGVVLVSATGNNGENGIFYPAQFQHVIAVGNLNEFNRRATSSNYGIGLDLLAPGTNINATGLNQIQYTVSGTSFATPIVTATVSMIQDVFPDLNAEQIKSHLRLTSDDIGNTGYDIESGAGKLNIYRSVSEFTYNSIQINYPNAQTFHQQSIPIIITANGTHINSDLNLRITNNTQVLYENDFSQVQFNSEIITTLNAGDLSSGNYRIVLSSGNEELASAKFYVDHNPPQLDTLIASQIVDKTSQSIFLEGVINKQSVLSLESDLISLKSGRFFNILPNKFTAIDTLIGLIKDENNLSTNISVPVSKTGEIKNEQYHLGERLTLSGRYIVAEFTTDIDFNGNKEFWVYHTNDGISIDTMTVFEMNGSQMIIKKKSIYPYIIRDTYYSSSFNKHYTLFSYNGRTIIQEIGLDFSFNQLANRSDIGLGAKLINIKGDDEPEVFVRSTFKYHLYSMDLTTKYFDLDNFANGNAVLGIPNIQLKTTNDTTYAYFNDSEGHILQFRLLFDSEPEYIGSLEQTYSGGIQTLKLINNKLYVLGEEVGASLFDDNQYDMSRRALDVFSFQNEFSPILEKTIYFQDYSFEAAYASIMPFQNEVLVHNGYELYKIDSTFSVSYLTSNIDNITFTSSNNIILYSDLDELNITEYSPIDAPFPIAFDVENFKKDSFLIRVNSASLGDSAFVTLSNSTGNLKQVLISDLNSRSHEYFIQNGNTAFEVEYYKSGNVFSYELDVIPEYNKPQIIAVDILTSGVLLKTNTSLNNIDLSKISFRNSTSLSYSILNDRNVLFSMINLANSDTIDIRGFADRFGRVFSDTTLVFNKSEPPLSLSVLSYEVEKNKSISLQMSLPLPSEVSVEGMDHNDPFSYEYMSDHLIIKHKKLFRAGEHYGFKITTSIGTAYFGYTFPIETSKTILFPNPIITKEHDYISITNLEQYDVLRIFNLYGRKIYERAFTDTTPLLKLNIKSDFKVKLKSGIYYYVITKDKKVIRDKFTIIN